MRSALSQKKTQKKSSLCLISCRGRCCCPLPQSQSASLRGRCLCRSCCCCELISSGAAFDSKRRDAVSWKTFERLPFGISLLANLRRVGRKNQTRKIKEKIEKKNYPKNTQKRAAEKQKKKTKCLLIKNVKNIYIVMWYKRQSDAFVSFSFLSQFSFEFPRRPHPAWFRFENFRNYFFGGNFCNAPLLLRAVKHVAKRRVYWNSKKRNSKNYYYCFTYAFHMFTPTHTLSLSFTQQNVA